MTDFKPSAWTGEDGEVVIYGTHNASRARMLTLVSLAECGFAPHDEEWPNEADRLEFYESLPKLWTFPKDVEQPFDRFPEWCFGAVPWMVGEPDYEWAAATPKEETHD